MFSHTLDTTPNGLPVLRIPMPGINSLTVLALANTGSRYETPNHYGIAHFFEHMVFKGTANFPQAQDLAAAVDGIGADFNAFTSKEYTGYYVKAAGRHLDLALDVVSDMLLTPQLRQEDIDREKGVIVEEINMYQDIPQRLIANLFDELAYPDSGLAHPIIGSAETVTKLTTADFQQFLQNWYGLPNLVLVIAGDEKIVSARATFKKINEFFSKQTEDRVESKVDVKKDLVAAPIDQIDNAKNSRLHLETKPTEQAHFILGWPGFKRSDKERYPLVLLDTILGGNMSSRLFTEIREKRGLAYYVSTETDFYHDRGLFGVRAGVDTKRLEEAIEVTLQEFHNLPKTNLITKGELARAKEYLAGKMALQYEDPQAVAQYYGMKQLLTNEIETPDEVLAKIKAVTLEEIQAIIEKILQPNTIKLAVIGPESDSKKLEKFLV